MNASPQVPLGRLFLSFTGIGAVMFGGGYAMLPLLEREIVERRRWCAHDEMSEYYALAQIVPGVIAVNIAMLIGYRHRGLRGAVVAATGTILVPFVVILLIAIIFQQLAATHFINAVFAGLRPAVAGLLLAAAWNLLRRGCQNVAGVVLATIAAALLLTKCLGPAGLIVAGIAAGVIWQIAVWWRLRRDAPPLTTDRRPS